MGLTVQVLFVCHVLPKCGVSKGFMMIDQHVKFSIYCIKGKFAKRAFYFILNIFWVDTPKIVNILLKNVSTHSMMFAYRTMGGRIDKSVNQGQRPYYIKFGWQNYHRIKNLLLDDGNWSKFQQLYIVNTQNKIINRIQELW